MNFSTSSELRRAEEALWKWHRREEKRKKRLGAMPQHGKGMAQFYKDATQKRARSRVKRLNRHQGR